MGLSRIKVGIQDCLWLGNLDALRDWGHARDYVKMMWLMLQQAEPADYVIATGEQHSVRTFVEEIAETLEIELTWSGEGLDEVGVDGAGRTIVRVDRRYFRPAEVESLLGDARLAQKKLGWSPTVTFQELAREMALSDLKLAYRQRDSGLSKVLRS